MYQALENRYQTMKYYACGNSGLKLPAVSLGLWHNFGDTSNYANMEQMIFTAFDQEITHFDLANNYGPKPATACGMVLTETGEAENICLQVLIRV